MKNKISISVSLKRLIVVIFLSCLQLHVFAQDQYFEKVSQVKESGYYNIALSREMIAEAHKNDFNKLRLKDAEGREIPYFLKFKSDLKFSNKYLDLNIIEDKSDAKNSIVIIENKSELETIYIQIKSLEVDGKRIQIRASHNGEQWYLVKATTPIWELGQHFDANDDVFEVSFPKGTYKYYELELSNSQSLPIEILSVKVNEVQKPYTYPIIEIPMGKMIQIDSSNQTSILKFPDLEYTYFIEKLEFDISSIQNYLRNTYISDTNIYFNLSSKSNNQIETNGFLFDKNRTIVIENHDNVPVVVNKFKAYSSQVFMCAYIGENQSLEVSLNTKLKEIPNYDINNFKSELSKKLEVLPTFGFVKIRNQGSDIKSEVKTWFESETFMWSAIVIAGIFLLWSCLRIAKDLKNKEQKT